MSLTNAVAIDCEMVTGPKGKNLLAQVTIVNENFDVVYNKYVHHNNVIDYRTQITGFTQSHLASGSSFEDVKADVARIIKGRRLVGHAIFNDLKSLGISHPKFRKRDTAKYLKTNQELPSLKDLALKHLGMSIQNGVHNALEDARACMRLYKLFEKQWEKSLNSPGSKQ